jgi:hypothetical protein
MSVLAAWQVHSLTIAGGVCILIEHAHVAVTRHNSHSGELHRAILSLSACTAGCSAPVTLQLVDAACNFKHCKPHISAAKMHSSAADAWWLGVTAITITRVTAVLVLLRYWPQLFSSD